ncbi:MAG: S8/S53 family peptidase [Cyanobacteria bacterium SZAS TMP-1]|nr:S8/S53 family peptidase [Cyanobacteria bacterium SZAS TMP-1]
MKPHSKQSRLLRLISVTGLIVLALWMVIRKDDIFSFFSDPVTLSGSVPEVVQQSQQIQHADPEAQLEIVVGLKARNEADLDALINRQQDPSSPDYQRFISPDEFTQRFAPTQSQVDGVVNFLTANGLKIKRVYSNHLLIHAVGNIAQLEKAFGVTINQYQLPGPTAHNTMAASTKYFSNDRDPSIPAGLKDVIESVIGLNTLDAFESRVRHARATPSGYQRALTPQDVATAYNYPNDNNKVVPAAGAKYNGHGVTVAIATAYGYDRADVETYWKTHNVTRTGNLTDVPINGTTAKLEEETTLDLELAGSQAPGADILMYIASSPAFINFTLTFGQIVIDNKADVMTVSWGLCEEHTGWLQMKTESLIFRQAAVQGIAVFASAGDDGAYDCGADAKKVQWRVDFPSSSPHVTAVGGTALHVSDSVRTTETTWESGGGGVSSHWDRPVWQVAPTLPSGNRRATADVSLNGDPATGYSFYFQGRWMRIGGTSASAPEWAALWALVMEGTKQRVGSANFYVYRMGALKEYHKYFYDVIRGNNGAGVGNGYNAGPGWDIPSGWGTPNGAEIINWMIKVSPAVPPKEKTLGEKHPGLMFSKSAPALPGQIFR